MGMYVRTWKIKGGKMREIKFRAWFPKTKRMTVAFMLGQLIENIENTRREEKGFYLQFTGLKDKNGKEVYQGDILKITDDKKGYGSVSYGGFAEILSETCGFSFRCFNPTIEELDEQWGKGGDGWDSSSLWHTLEPKNIEVIGNIYENPELLKDSK